MSYGQAVKGYRPGERQTLADLLNLAGAARMAADLIPEGVDWDAKTLMDLAHTWKVPLDRVIDALDAYEILSGIIAEVDA